ncbi:MAG: glycoside hydrolase family 73 protein, partial [Bacilli bacterium]|nr:glycoside hydrolase family 73 protein [Bacilli bacterium]
SVFMGPISDNVKEAIESLYKSIESVISNYNTLSSYLDETLSSYESADKIATNKILSINDKGELEVTEGTGLQGGLGTIAEGEYLNPGNMSGSKLEFLKSIINGAISAYKKYGVLPSLTLAQAILETGWGKSKIGNNIFGIKAGSSWTGKTKTVGTKEWENGHYKSIRATFRDYDSIEESIEDHAKLLTNKRYQPVLSAKNYKEACRLVKECGYATSPTYTKSLTDLVEQFGLNQYDPK